MSNFKSTYATDNRVESTVHIISHYLRAATNKLGAKKAYTDYFVMTGDLVEELINSYQNRDAKSALVIDDIGLQVINRLIQEGVKDITLALARVPEENLETVKYIIHNTFPEFNIKIISIEEIEGMKPDLVIANPPYGKIGAEITKKIIDTVDFKEYINLLPANDYKRVNCLWNYQSDMRPGSKPGTSAFSDAAVTTHVARIHKNKVNTMTLDEFERSQYIDRSLDKYFEENSKRSHYAIDNAITNTPVKIFKKLSNKTTYVQGAKDVNHKHLPKSKTCVQYMWNVLKIIDGQYVAENCECYIGGKKTGRPSGSTSYYTITFNSSTEKDNFTSFIYSNVGQQFFSKICSSINADSYVLLRKLMPKVDWTRSWTVEEILADYGYTEEEIKEVMEDLKNYKGMED